MSANNYSQCPKCLDAEATRQSAAIERADSQYGKVSATKYAELLADAKPRKVEETLREYYQLGIYEGVFAVTYSSSCDQCDFEFNFKHKESVKMPQGNSR